MRKAIEGAGVRRTGRVAAALAALWLLAAAGVVPAAGDVPDTRQMIDALKPAGGARNLAVRPARPASTTAAASAPLPDGGAAAVVPALPAPPLPPAGAVPAAPAPRPAGLSLALPFESNSARLRPESGNVLGNLVAALLSPELKGSRFVIEGHTDARGTVAANQRLSQERAEEVRLFLVALGVHPARLRAVGKGASELLNPGNPQAAENRRVRLVAVE